jgi:hypothetical protein
VEWARAFGWYCRRLSPPRRLILGTIFIDPDIVTPASPTNFLSAVYAGQANRVMFDRRTGSFSTFNAYLVNVTFSDRPAVEFQVNPQNFNLSPTVRAVRGGVDCGGRCGVPALRQATRECAPSMTCRRKSCTVVVSS